MHQTPCSTAFSSLKRVLEILASTSWDELERPPKFTKNGEYGLEFNDKRTFCLVFFRIMVEVLAPGFEPGSTG